MSPDKERSDSSVFVSPPPASEALSPNSKALSLSYSSALRSTRSIVTATIGGAASACQATIATTDIKTTEEPCVPATASLTSATKVPTVLSATIIPLATPPATPSSSDIVTSMHSCSHSLSLTPPVSVSTIIDQQSLASTTASFTEMTPAATPTVGVTPPTIDELRIPGDARVHSLGNFDSTTSDVPLSSVAVETLVSASPPVTILAGCDSDRTSSLPNVTSVPPVTNIGSSSFVSVSEVDDDVNLAPATTVTSMSVFAAANHNASQTCNNSHMPPEVNPGTTAVANMGGTSGCEVTAANTAASATNTANHRQATVMMQNGAIPTNNEVVDGCGATMHRNAAMMPNNNPMMQQQAHAAASPATVMTGNSNGPPGMMPGNTAMMAVNQQHHQMMHPYPIPQQHYQHQVRGTA